MSDCIELFRYIHIFKLLKLFKNYYWSFDDVDPNEIWVSSKDIYPEYEEFLTSLLGKLKRVSLGHITYGFKRGGYLSVKVVDKLTGKHIAKQMHVLILSCFIGRQDNMEVNHKDGVKDNNNLTNLEYTTSSENTIRAIGLGLIDYSKRNPYKVKVIQLSLDNIYIAEYKSIRDASQILGINESSISRACSNKKSAGGYKWEKL